MNGLQINNFLAHFLKQVISRIERLIRRTRGIDDRMYRTFIVFAYVRD